MTISVTHTFVSTIPDDADTSLVRPSNWNAVHAISGTMGNASLDDMAANTIKGRLSTTGAPQDLTGTQTTALLDTFTSSLNGLAPSSGGGAVNFLRADGTWATPAGSGIVSDGDKGDITVSGTGTVWTIDNDVVSYAKMQNVSATSRFIGRITSGSGDAEELTGTQATTLLDAFTSSLKGLAPSSGGGTTNFLRADGTWNAPPSGGTPGGSTLQLQYNNASAFAGMSGTSWDDTNRSLTMTGATVTTSNPVLNMTQTWNAVGTVFTGLLLNVIQTAASSSSLLADFRTTSGGNARSMFSIKATPSGGILLGDSYNDGQTIIQGGTNSVTIQGSLTTTNFGILTKSIRLDTASGDVYLNRGGVATLQMGQPDAAAPIAQTLQVQSVVAGTSNTAGADWTFNGSKGTGTGAGGSIIFKTSPIGTTGTAQNAAVEVARFSPSGNTTNTGIFQIGTAAAADSTYPKLYMPNNTGNVYLGSYSGIFIVSNNLASSSMNGAAYSARLGPLDITLPSNGLIGFASTTTGAIGAGSDVILSRGGAGATLQHGLSDGAAPVAQTIQVQSTVAGTSNTAGADWTLQGSRSTGNAAGGNIIFKTAQLGTSGTSQNAATEVFRLRPTGPLLPAGTATLAPLTFTAGTNLTTAADGAMEFDGLSLFFSPDASDRRILPAKATIRQHATYTLANSASVQKLFNGSTNGALTLPIGAYFFECMCYITAMSATSGNAAFSIANGTGTATNFLFASSATDGAAGTIGTGSLNFAITSATPAAIATAAVATTLGFQVEGSFEVSVAGTIIPSIQLANAAAAVVSIGSYFNCWRMGADTAVTVGNWS